MQIVTLHSLLFELGQTAATQGALDLMGRTGVTPLHLLRRHQRGDWGNLDADDCAANDRAVKGNTRILSAYELGTRKKIWVITEADRSVTTILLPGEY